MKVRTLLDNYIQTTLLNGIDFYDDNKKIKNDIQKIKEKLGMSRYYTNSDEDSL
jgi:hypothetical protein